MMELFRELRHAARALRRAPAFTAVALLTLAVAIGANGAIFSVVNGVLLAPLPYPDSDRLVALHRVNSADEADISVPDAEDLRQEALGLATFGLYFQGWAFDLTGTGDPERLTATVAEPEFFEVLATPAAQGRVYGRSDGAAAVAVLSHAFWQARFHGGPVVGRTLVLSDVPYTVVGVMPAAFSAFEPQTQLWVPPAAATLWAATSRGSNNFEVLGRLAPGATVAGVTAALRAATGRLAAEYPGTNRGKVLVAEGLVSLLTRTVRPAVWALFGAVGLVLLLAAANLAALLLGRAELRASEYGVRVALGAGARGLARGAVLECLLLAVPGGLLGLGLSVWGTAAILSLAGGALPRADEVRVDGTVVLFTAALTIGTMLLFSLAPAARASRADPARVLGGTRGGRGRESHGVLGALAVTEVALAALLLVGALLLGRSFVALQRVDLGFRAPGLVAISLTLPESRYGTRPAQTAAFAAILDRVNAAPGVRGAATVIGGPLGTGGEVGSGLAIEGWVPPDPADQPSARSRPVGGNYFALLGIPIRAGRAFDARDTEQSALVAIINEALRRTYFGDSDPIGRRLAWRFNDGPPRWMTIVGVAGDVRAGSLREGDEVAVYTPYPQREPDWERFGTLMVRGDDATGDLAQAVRKAVLAVDPALPIGQVLPLPEAAARSLTAERLSAVIFAVLAAVALVMAGQGLYGLLALVVAARRREMGVRLALGAMPVEVVALVLARALRLVLLGLGGGLVAALALGRLVAGQLYGVAAGSPWVYLASALGLLVVALLSAWLPARRAARVDPATVLRSE